MAEKQVLYKVDIKLDDAVEALGRLDVQLQDIDAAIQAKTASLRKAETAFSDMADKDSDAAAREAKAIDTLRSELVILKQQRKAVSKETTEQTRQVQNSIIAENKYAGTLKGLCAQLSLAKDQLRAMSMEDPEFAKKAEEVGRLNDKVKEMEASYGTFTRNVGNYGMAVSSTKDKIAELVQEIARLTASGQENSDEFQKAKAQLDAYSNSLTADGVKSTKTYQKGIVGLVGALSLMTSLVGTDTEEGQKLRDIMQKLQIVTAALAAVTKIYNTLQKKGLVQKMAETIQIKAATASINLETAAKSGNTVATIAATAAQKALNAAMKANPIVLLVSALAALGTGLVAVIKWIGKSTSSQKEAVAAQKGYEEQSKKTTAALDALNSQQLKDSVDMTVRHNKELKQMMESGATKEEIEETKRRQARETHELELKYLNEQTVKENEAVKAAVANYQAQQKRLDELTAKKGEDAKATQKQKEKVEEAEKAVREACDAVNNTLKEMDNTAQQIVEDDYNAAQDAMDKTYDRLSKHLANTAKLRQSSLKTMEKYEYDYTKSAEENAEAEYLHKIQWQRAVQDANEESLKASLKLQLKYGKITVEDYKSQLAQMDADRVQFEIDQENDVKSHVKALADAAVELAGGKDMDGRLQEVRDKYAAAERDIKNDATKSADEKAYYLQNLADKEAREEQRIRLEFDKKTNDELMERARAVYEDDVRQFSDSEQDRLSLEADVLKELIKMRKDAGLDTLAEERDLARTETKERAAELDKQLTLHWDNARERYQIQKDYLEQELEQENLTDEQIAKLRKQLAELTASYNQQQIQSFQNYANEVTGILSSLNTVAANLEDAQVNKAEAANDEKKKSLQKQLDAGLISQKKYDKETEKLDEELDAEKLEIEQKQAKREKALNAFQIVINTAAAIMKAWSEGGPYAGAVFTALIAAAGAAELAAVLTEPLPTAREGGLVKGKKHEQGGVLVNTEGDERIISSQPSKAFPELLNLISYIGKHANIPDTGYSSRYFGTASSGGGDTVAEVDVDTLAEKIGAKVSDAVANMKIYTSVEDVRKADAQYTRIINSAKI